jgi:hypothetical protein
MNPTTYPLSVGNLAVPTCGELDGWLQLTAFGARSERFYSFAMQHALLTTEPQSVGRDHLHCNQRGAAGAITRIASAALRFIVCIATDNVGKIGPTG